VTEIDGPNDPAIGRIPLQTVVEFGVKSHREAPSGLALKYTGMAALD
jgi:hypothetical protein